MSWTAPRTWVAAETVTASIMNVHVRDNLKAIGDAWASYSPTWTATGTNPAIGNGSIAGRAALVGKTVLFRAVVTMGTTTTFGTGTYLLDVPAAAVASAAGRCTMGGSARDDSAAADYPIWGIVAASTVAAPLRTLPTTAGNAFAGVNATVPFTLANLDSLTIEGAMEAA